MEPITEKLEGNVSVTTINGFARAYSVGVDAQGRVYVPDMPANNVVVFDPSLNLQGAYDIKDGRLQASSTAGQRIDRALPSDGIVAPHSVSFDSDGVMYLTEYKGNRVTKIAPDGAVLGRIGIGELINPVVSYVERDGYLYVGSFGSDQAMRYTVDGKLQGWIGATQDNQPPTGWRLGGKPAKGSAPGALDRVHAIRLGPDGNLYLVDTWNHRIVKYSHDGKFLGWSGARAAGGVTNGWSAEGYSRASAELGGFNAPIELEFDASGLMYITDCYNNRIVRMGLNGQPLGWLGAAKGSKPEARWRTEGRPEADNRVLTFNQPYGLRIRKGRLYVADTNNQRLVVIDAPDLNLK
jgi:tripartite motif-containing protein 71